MKIEVSLYSYHYLNRINSNLTNYFPHNEQTRLNFLKLSKPMVAGCWLLGETLIPPKNHLTQNKKGSERTNAPNPRILINLKTYFL